MVFGHGRFAVFFDGIILPLTPGLALAPARFKQAAAFHAMEHRVKHAVGPLELAAGAGFDFLDDGVAVALALGQQ